MMTRLLKAHEFYAALLLVVVVVAIGAHNPAFYTLGNIFSLSKSSIVLGIFSLGTLIVLVSGGIDVSFPAIAMFAMYMTSRNIGGLRDAGWVSVMVVVVAAVGIAAVLYALLVFARPPKALAALLAVAAAGLAAFLGQRYLGSPVKDTSIVTIFVLGMAIGAGLGCVNAFLIAFFKFPTLIVTLGTSSAIAGIVHNFVSTAVYYNIPPAMTALSRWEVVTVTMPRGDRVGLSGAIFIFLGLAVLTSFILNRTMLGRGVYALGGDPVSAERIGLKVKSVKFFIYPFVGLLGGAAGVIHSSFMRNSRATDLLGTELNVIAAVVLGGASIGGGKGTVLGTLIGVVLITIINNSLILMGISSYWQKVTTGVVLILATGIPALAAILRNRGRV